MFAVVTSVVVVVVLLFCLLTTEKKEEMPEGASNNQVREFGTKGGINNPGFLIHTNIDWKGKDIGGSRNCKFENFQEMHWGIRAWFINLWQKYNKGTITNTAQMIDVLTPAGKENAENARNNYKKQVAKARSWIELGFAVFNFEANPDWRVLDDSTKTKVLMIGISEACTYVYGSGNLPQYFNS